MFSNTNDMNPIITRDNYEEYFLMYVDDELTPAERSMVEAFVQFNPELQAELDMLMGTKLQPEPLNFSDKESLFARSMSQNLVDESLLLHVDNELPEEEKKKTEQRLQHDKEYNAQFQWLLRTKSDPAEVVLHPNKEELYRHTVRRIDFAPALRIAAAVLLIASMGVVWWMQDSKENTAPAVAANPAKKQQKSNVGVTPDVARETKIQPVIRQQNVTNINEASARQLAQVTTTKKLQAAARKKTAELPAIKEVQPQAPKPEAYMAYNDAPVLPKGNNSVHPDQPQVHSQNTAATGVTSPGSSSYNNTETTAAPVFAASKNDDDGERGGKNNLKSLLRKATRLVERRAHIDATNDDDELIIGAVAIKLK